MKAATTTLAATLLAAGCGAAPVSSVDGLRAEDPAAGVIRGVVRLRGAPADVAPLAIEKDVEVCGTTRPGVRLSLGPDNGVRNAIVYLEGVAPRVMPAGTVTISVDQRACEYVPRALAVPVGTQLEIVNSDPVLHNVHAQLVGEAERRTLFNIAQPIRGQRTAIEQTRVTKPGLLTLSCDAGHPWMSAHVFVAEHPYVAVTNERGEFSIDGVPPGSYAITMWHEGVRLTRVVASLQRYEYEDPYELTEQVDVAAGRDVAVDFELTLREPAGAN